MNAYRPDVSSSDEHWLFALQTCDTVHRELTDVITTVGVDLWELKEQKTDGQSHCLFSGWSLYNVLLLQ